MDQQQGYGCRRHARDTTSLCKCFRPGAHQLLADFIRQALDGGVIEILREPRGSGGFGYDPLFLLPEFGRTGAELLPEEKNRVSHRGRALAQLVTRLRAGR